MKMICCFVRNVKCLNRFDVVEYLRDVILVGIIGKYNVIDIKVCLNFLNVMFEKKNFFL